MCIWCGVDRFLGTRYFLPRNSAHCFEGPDDQRVPAINIYAQASCIPGLDKVTSTLPATVCGPSSALLLKGAETKARTCRCRLANPSIVKCSHTNDGGRFRCGCRISFAAVQRRRMATLGFLFAESPSSGIVVQPVQERVAVGLRGDRALLLFLVGPLFSY